MAATRSSLETCRESGAGVVQKGIRFKIAPLSTRVGASGHVGSGGPEAIGPEPAWYAGERQNQAREGEGPMGCLTRHSLSDASSRSPMRCRAAPRLRGRRVQEHVGPLGDSLWGSCRVAPGGKPKQEGSSGRARQQTPLARCSWPTHLAWKRTEARDETPSLYRRNGSTTTRICAGRARCRPS